MLAGVCKKIVGSIPISVLKFTTENTENAQRARRKIPVFPTRQVPTKLLHTRNVTETHIRFAPLNLYGNKRSGFRRAIQLNIKIPTAGSTRFRFE